MPTEGNTNPSHDHWMNLALSLAKTAQALGEVPVGALVIKDNKVLASGFNLRESSHNPCAHAEILALAKAAQIRQNWRLTDCDLYVTLEPCLMCAGALYQARIRKVYFATFDPKAGALGSLYQIHEDQRLNHRFTVESGTKAREAQTLLKDFFAARRLKQESNGEIGGKNF